MNPGCRRVSSIGQGVQGDANSSCSQSCDVKCGWLLPIGVLCEVTGNTNNGRADAITQVICPFTNRLPTTVSTPGQHNPSESWARLATCHVFRVVFGRRSHTTMDTRIYRQPVSLPICGRMSWSTQEMPFQWCSVSPLMSRRG